MSIHLTVFRLTQGWPFCRNFLYYLLLCWRLIWCSLLWMWLRYSRYKNGCSESSSVCVHVCLGDAGLGVCVCTSLRVCVCVCVWSFACFTLMLYKDIIILLHGSYKLNIFHKALYWVRTSTYCCKITFLNDERKFTFHEKSNSSWTAEFKTIK